MTKKDIQESVAARFTKMGPELVEFAITKIVEEEVQKRGKQVTDAFIEHESLMKRYNRMNRPDVFRKDREGKMIEGSEGYSDERLKELKQVSERMEKIDKALEDAFESKFDRLDNLGSNKKDSSGSD